MRRVWDEFALRCAVVYLMPLWLLLLMCNLEAWGAFDVGLVANAR